MADSSNTVAHEPANDCGEEIVLCVRCGTGRLEPCLTRTALWRGTSLVVIRNVPAMICTSCGEEYVDDRTALGLDRMQGEGLGSANVAERMIVPVLDYSEPEGWSA